MKYITTIILLTSFSPLTSNFVLEEENKTNFDNVYVQDDTYCHVQVDCDKDGIPDYWGDVDCEYEDGLREQYLQSCDGPIIND